MLVFLLTVNMEIFLRLNLFTDEGASPYDVQTTKKFRHESAKWKLFPNLVVVPSNETADVLVVLPCHVRYRLCGASLPSGICARMGTGIVVKAECGTLARGCAFVGLARVCNRGVRK